MQEGKRQVMQSCCKQEHMIYGEHDSTDGSSVIVCEVCGFFMEERIPLVQLTLKWRKEANARVHA